MTEKEFWNCTFRKLMLLWDDYRKLNGFEDAKEEKKVYVNDIF
jgi:hypothetical protein